MSGTYLDNIVDGNNDGGTGKSQANKGQVVGSAEVDPAKDHLALYCKLLCVVMTWIVVEE